MLLLPVGPFFSLISAFGQLRARRMACCIRLSLESSSSRFGILNIFGIAGLRIKQYHVWAVLCSAKARGGPGPAIYRPDGA